MAVKKSKKKAAKKKVVLTQDEKEELVAEGELPKKSAIKRENKQLIWFFVVVAIIFGLFLVPYFWVESSKHFEYAGINWVIEEYAAPVGDIYHGDFMALNGANLRYNVYLRSDPRKNDVPTYGSFDKFKNLGAISFSPEFNACRGRVVGGVGTLDGFLSLGVGTGFLTKGSTNSSVAEENGWLFATCETVFDKTLVILEKGEARVVQDEENPYCYTIYVDDCNNADPIEKFIAKSIEDFNKAKEELRKAREVLSGAK